MDVSVSFSELSEKLLHQWGQPQQAALCFRFLCPCLSAAPTQSYEFITSHLLRQLHSKYTNPEIPLVV